jgi:hypothetical protein
MSKIPWKTIFAIGFVIGFVGIVYAVTFAPGDAGQVSDGVPFGAPDGMNASIAGDTNVIMESDVLYPSSDTVQMKTEAGNITFQSSGPAWAQVSTTNITGTYTNITEIDAQNDITINPEDKAQATVGKDIEHFAWRDNIALDDSTVDFRYGGTSGTAKVTVRGVAANTDIRAVDAQSKSLLGQATSDGSGVVTFTSLSQSSHSVLLQTATSEAPSLSNGSPDGDTLRVEDVQLSIDLSDPDLPSDSINLTWYVNGSQVDKDTGITSGGTYTSTVTLPDDQHSWYVVAEDQYGNTDTSSTYSFTIQHYTPDIQNVSPSGNLQADPSTISADVSDLDFPNDGDTVDVTIDLDGSQIDSQTINSNSTVSTSMPSSGKTGGQHDIAITATDQYGNSRTVTASYSVPNTFFVRNETRHSELIPTDGEIRFFGTDQVYTRTAASGQFDMTGLPVDQEFIVVVDPTSDDFHETTLYVQSIYDQQTAYVLNETAYETVQDRFVLNDPTGTYDSDDVVEIQRAINISGTETFQTIRADRFGAEGYTTTLQNDTRYRLKIIGDESEQKVGVFRASLSETVEVQPGNPTIPLNITQTGYAYNAVLDNRTLEYAYSDPQDATGQLIVWIHERGNPSNKLQPNETAFDIGNYSGVATLTANESEKEWVVNFIVKNRGGEDFSTREIVRNQANLTPPVDSGWQLVMGIGMIVLFAGAFSVLNAAVGAVVVSLVGGLLWFLGFLGGATTGAAVVIAIFISVISYMYKGAF